MALYRPKELLEKLRHLHASPQKTLSQNFLVDGNILRKIIQTAALSPGDLVIEIGAGPGALTEQLLLHGARVVAIEKDPLFAEGLKELQSLGELEVYREDFLEFDLSKVLKGEVKKAKVVANLPYHITAPVLFSLLPRSDDLESLNLLIQKEVAERLVAKPHSRTQSALTILANAYSDISLAFLVKPTCFIPRPKVTSAFVKMVLHPPPDGIDMANFSAFVHKLYGQRRKSITTVLKEEHSKESVAELLERQELSPMARPEELSLEQMIYLFTELGG